MSKRTLGFLGTDFEIGVLKLLIDDTKFALRIIDYLDNKHFDNHYTKYILQIIKEHYIENGDILTYKTIEKKIITQYSKKPELLNVVLDTLNDVHNPKEEINESYIKKTVLNFIKQQVLKKEIKKVNKIIDEGEFGEYDQIENILINATLVGEDMGNIEDPFNNIRDVITKDIRTPISTGVEGLDRIFNGGLSHGELGVLIAPTGVGKTTLLTKFANTAFNEGKNVLQIIFEDNISDIKRKHYTLWSGIAPDEHIERVDEVEEKVLEAKKNSKGLLKILKFRSDTTTLSKIKSKIKHLKSENYFFDELIIDYADCIVSEEKNYGEEWKGEGAIMRGIESMSEEFNIATWVATQGNRDSLKNELVTSDQVGGSIKKIAVAHVVISVGKTIDQKFQNLATMAILKSRIGGDGIVYQNCTFDNKYINIDTDEQNTFVGFKEDKEERNRERLQELSRASEVINNNNS